jgi:hypothetical protein
MEYIYIYLYIYTFFLNIYIYIHIYKYASFVRRGTVNLEVDRDEW